MIRTIERLRDAHLILLEVLLNNHRVADVRKERDWQSGAWEPATVNWSAWGAKDAAMAARFADALHEAADVARELDRAN